MPRGRALYVKRGTGGAARAILDEVERLRWLAPRMPAARPVDTARAGDSAWIVTEALPGRSAGDRMLEDRAAIPRVIAGLAGFVRRLHALPAGDCPFESTVAALLPEARRRVGAGLVDTDDFDEEHDGWSAAPVLREVVSLADAAVGRVVTHGDLTLGNLVLDTDFSMAGCIDVGRLGVADPYQDIALLWRDLGGFGSEAQAAFLRALPIDAPDRRRMMLHTSLDELF